MLLVWRERSVPPPRPTLPPPLAACSQDALLQSWPQAYACLSSEDVFILLSMHGYRRARHCCHGTLASLQAAAASPTGQGSQKEQWMPMQGEVGWKQPRSAESLRRAGTEEQELLQSQGWADAAAGEIRARQPRATLCRSFPGGQGLAEGGQGLLPPLGGSQEDTCTQHPPRVGERIGTGTSGICPPPPASPGILQISPLSQPLAAYK